MAAIVSLLVVLSVSMFVTRLATVALGMTGLTRSLARLQAVSAFTGVGFTTSESEALLEHPVRRRILVALMVVGNAGFVAAISSLVVSFVQVDRAEDAALRLGVLLAGVTALWLLSRSSWLERHVEEAMEWALTRWTRLEVLDVVRLLQLTGDYTIREMWVEAGDWVQTGRIASLDLFEEGITILGIHRADGEYIGAPRGETEIRERDRLVLYGREEALEQLSRRRRGSEGDEAHDRAVEEQRREQRDQQVRDARQRADQAREEQQEAREEQQEAREEQQAREEQ